MNNLKKVKCKNCGKAIYRSLGRINENLKLGNNFYCSRKCEYQYKTKKKNLTCENCGKQFERTPHEVSLHNYCSRSCATIVNNRKNPKRKAQFRTCLGCGKQFKKSLGNLKYCSAECRRKTEYYTQKKVLNILSKIARKLRRTPSRREVNGVDKVARRLFGSWNNAVSAAGLTPNRSHSNRMYKRTNAKASDGHLCDSISELLIDNWLNKNKIEHKRNVPYPDTNHKADWGINFKKEIVFIEYFGLAKDSPRYDESIIKKKALCRKYKIKLIEIYSSDLYPKIKLDTKFKVFLK